MTAVSQASTLPALPQPSHAGVAADVGVPVRWVLTRNCSLSPRQVAGAYALLCALSLVVSLGFLMAGFGIVLVFCGLELLAMGAAWLLWGRRVGQGEVIRIHEQLLRVDMQHGTATTHLEWPVGWIRVIEDGTRVLLACGSRRVEVGTQVTWAQRQRFARELRRSLAAPPHAST